MSDNIQARRGLQIALGIVWLLDAALQFQPFMFGRGFATQIIEPAAAGDPGPVARPLLWSAHLMAAHPVACNAAFAVVQLAIAVGLLVPRTVRPALAVSVAWALGVWWLGEGLGGTLTGASPLSGAPGAVVLYALIAWLVWPGAETRERAVPRVAWSALWGGFAVYLLLPANRAADAVSQVFAGAGAGEPGWIRALDRALAGLTAGHGLAVSVLLAGLCLIAGAAVGVRSLTRPGLVLAGLLGLLFWVAQAFGGLATGMATDPNSGPLLILLAACFWPAAAEPAAESAALNGVGAEAAGVSGCRSARADPTHGEGPRVLPVRRARGSRRAA
ncbi:MAG TPA: hypothetical protein VHU92_22270 [Streptosporangiaceae bacterium]|jgi:hypothetical protein|nr:hypothetical protein [Streptosporangiaceae bacterium]